jgi:hypothetical protein
MSCEQYRSSVYAAVGVPQYHPLRSSHAVVCPSIVARAEATIPLNHSDVAALIRSAHRTKQLAGVTLWGWFGQKGADDLIRLLRTARDQTLRRAVVTALGRGQPGQYVELLLERFRNDRSLDVRATIPAFVARDPNAAEYLITHLESQPARVQAAIVDALPSVADDAQHVIRSWIDSDPPERALAALTALSDRPALAELVVNAWKQWLFHDRPEIRHEAARRWSKVGSIPHLAAPMIDHCLTQLHPSADPDRLVSALYALLPIRLPREPVHQIESYLSHLDPQVCLAALMVLDHQHHLPSHHLVDIMHRHPYPDVSVAAGWLLGSSERHRPMASSVASIANTTDAYYRALAAYVACCGWGDETALEPLLHLNPLAYPFRPWFPEVIRNAVAGLVYPDVHTTCAEYLHHHAHQIDTTSYRLLFAHAAAAYGCPEMWEWVSPLWKDPNPDHGREILRAIRAGVTLRSLPFVIDSVVSNPAWDERDDVAGALIKTIDAVGTRYYAAQSSGSSP